MWRHFDRDSIDNDLAIIRDLGFSCIRVFPLWEDFQPKPKTIQSAMLDRLVDLLEIASEKSLQVMVTLFTGYVGGLVCLPPWMLLASSSYGQKRILSIDKIRSNKTRNPYSDSEVIEAQIFFLRELLSAVSGHPALYGWNLGNEPSQWALPADRFSVELWLQVMAETLKERDNTLPLTLTLRVADLTETSGLTPGLAAKQLDFLAINVPQHPTWWTKDPVDAGVLPCLGRITAWLAQRPVLIQEFGLATQPLLSGTGSLDLVKDEDRFLVNEEDAAQFAENALLHLQRFDLMGGFWKSYGDYHPSIWGWPPLDTSINSRFSGLVRHDGSFKPAASVFKSRPVQTVQVKILDEWLDVSEQEYYRNPRHHLSRLCNRFREYSSLG
jgi:hypothetical protein